MRVVTGQVVVAETGVGVAGLTVVAFAAGNQRIGSVLSDRAGQFRIEYGVDEVASAAHPSATAVNAQVPIGVRVVVFADSSSADLTQALFVETAARSPAGAVESYGIRIGLAKLIAAGVHLPIEPDDAAWAPHGQYAARLARGQVANVAVAAAGKPSIDGSRQAMIALGDALRNELRVRGRPMMPPSAPTTVAARVLDAMKRGVNRNLNGTTRTGHASLTTAEQLELAQRTGPGGELPPTDAERLLFGAGGVERRYTSLLTPAFRDPRLPAEKVVPPPPPVEPTPPVPPVPTIDAAVWRALSTSPGLSGTRPAPGDVVHRIGDLQLATGPADVTSVHDFSVLQLAFDHVWDDLVDERVVATAGKLHQAIARAGGIPAPLAPPPGGSGASPNALDWVVAEGARLVAALRDLYATNPPRDEVDDHRVGVSGPTHVGPRVDANGNPLTNYGVPAPQDQASRSGPRPHREPNPAADVERLLAELEKLIAEPYRFTVFAADATGTAINFGLSVTYRQRWQPLTYQVGKLVKTITLAPKEERSYSRKTTVTEKRKAETKERTRQLRRSEDSLTSRAVRDIVQSAQQHNTIDASYSATTPVSTSSIKATHDDQRSSSDTKQSFREAVRKATAEYESERTVDVTVESSFESVAEESGKLVNPNAELAVTYLFYELQRRFLVSERIHKLTPVILVAQPVPAPHEIDLKWILQHDWILRRALLDPSFTRALDLVTQDLVGEQFAVTALRQNVDTQRDIVEKLAANLVTANAALGPRYAALSRALQRGGATGSGSGFIDIVNNMLFGSSQNSVEVTRAREEVVRDAYNRAVDEAASLEERLAKESSLLSVLTDKWVAAQTALFNKTIEVDRLRLHIKQNILHYMQAIWELEPPDQRYFRLHQLPVPVLSGELAYSVVPDPTALPMPPTWTTPTTIGAKAQLNVTGQTVPLVEVADLERLLGYKGNYAVFPLVEPNVLTRYLSVPYVDRAAGLRDPDDLGNLTRDELDGYVRCLKQNLPADQFAALLPGINAAYLRLLSDPHPSEEEIVVPTDSLYIEALPAAQPILEDYQLQHRAVDVDRARAEVVRGSLENLRVAARLLGGEFTDEVDRKIVVAGARGVTLETGE